MPSCDTATICYQALQLCFRGGGDLLGDTGLWKIQFMRTLRLDNRESKSVDKAPEDSMKSRQGFFIFDIGATKMEYASYGDWWYRAIAFEVLSSAGTTTETTAPQLTFLGFSDPTSVNPGDDFLHLSASSIFTYSWRVGWASMMNSLIIVFILEIR